MSCVFCDIIAGKIPSLRVYEDAHAVVFMDIAKDVDGHMVAVPKKHAESILDCDGETLAQLMLAVKRVSEHCVHACGYEGVNLLNASGTAAGQSVPHFHIHIIPRGYGDGIDAWPTLPGAKRDIGEMFGRLRMKEESHGKAE